MKTVNIVQRIEIKTGWLNISTTDPLAQPYEQNPVVHDLLESIRSQLPYNQDINEKNSYDCSFNIPKSVDENTGTRSAAYQRIKNVQALKPSYLHVWTNTFVTKIILHPIRKKSCRCGIYQRIKSSTRHIHFRHNRQIVINGTNLPSMPNMKLLYPVGNG